ncbi:Uncharacterized protein family UPF0102 [Cyanobacterium stanieri PCC 7202]|uniref:UPF0102 protein Cyast_0918 n=1 Tax=Cyanobacterium stanieri (strain ATCC 29140 / PCC 7202) TaxID=292563 RepID=K9YKG8_CYASC|nr:Uncharacterized protein family UPF0102 [Cyanobacterium stanieri PCC 7202]
MTKIGELGEEVVALWLTQQHYRILYHRWHCRWGEIDLIALDEKINQLVFIEVKTRQPKNWDHDGLDMVNVGKQKKINITAQVFLSQHPPWQNYSCRFDLILVTYISRKNNYLQDTFKVLNHDQIMDKNHVFTIKKHLKNII